MSATTVVVSSPVANVASPTSANLLRQRSFALRFRTELCRKFETSGVCDYRDKCMFAHGEDELRTQERNEVDGLDSDKAIRAWIRDQRRVKAQLLASSSSESITPPMEPSAPPMNQLSQSAMKAEFRFDEYPPQIEAILAALLD